MEALCQISLEAVKNNYLYFQKRVAPAEIIPVVKANAYGHGALRITQFLLEELGVHTFAVATLEEAQELSQAFPDLNILIFSRVFPTELDLVPPNAILTLGSMEDAKALQESDRHRINVHLNVNTGMNRIGITPDEALELIAAKKSNLVISGVYSHFSSSDTLSDRVYKDQNTVFAAFVDALREMDFDGMIHMANSAAGLHDEQAMYDAVRLGIGLYGYDTTAGAQHQNYLDGVMTVLAPLIRIDRIRAGSSVSYAEKWKATTDTNIGTLRIGYADGYNRLLSNRGRVALNGKVYPVIGTVTMDHIMIDLGDDELIPGSMFEVLGGKNPELEINTVAKNLNSIPYEVCCSVSPRVKRVYTPVIP